MKDRALTVLTLGLAPGEVGSLMTASAIDSFTERLDRLSDNDRHLMNGISPR